MPDNREEEAFAQWLKDVNRLVAARFGGITLDDLPDMMTRDAFDSGTSVQDFYEGPVLDLIREEFGDEAVNGDES